MIARRVSSLARSVQFNARLPRNVSEELKSYAARRRISASAAAAELLDQALRTERFPGIDFRWTALGRQPYVTGTGLTVWEFRNLWLDHGKNVVRLLRSFPHYRSDQVGVALDYVKAYPGEEPPDFGGKKPPGSIEVQVPV